MEKTMAEQIAGVYRRKMDGSFDSICLNCLGTISMDEEAADADLDALHSCLPVFGGEHADPEMAA
jgi:hypothetical protein